MRVSHVHTAIHDPERQARIAAHARRVAKTESRERIKAECGKPVRISRLARMLRQMDLVDAMANNLGWTS